MEGSHCTLTLSGVPLPYLAQSGHASGPASFWSLLLLAVPSPGPSSFAFPPTGLASAGVCYNSDLVPSAECRVPRPEPTNGEWRIASRASRGRGRRCDVTPGIHSQDVRQPQPSSCMLRMEIFIEKTTLLPGPAPNELKKKTPNATSDITCKGHCVRHQDVASLSQSPSLLPSQPPSAGFEPG